VRAILLDPDDHVLLARFEFDTATIWALPGGGLEPDEHPEAGLRRELREELGLEQFELGPHVWTRVHVIPMLTGHDGQRDRIHLVRLDRFEPAPAIGWEALRAEFVQELRWWSVDEIAADRSERTWFAPRRLAVLMRQLLDDGPPPQPIDTGV
jgi:ADP-ribose pyrophosphatase YjhB (NUDIX family)